MDEARYRPAEERLWQSEGVAPTERWVRVGAAGTRVRVQVVGSGRPVLFVHGVSNSGSSWAPLAARLQDFECLLLDRPGCGLSEPIPNRFDDVAAFVPFAESLLVDVLDALGVPTADLVATSLGAQFAVRTAVAHPDRVRRLVLLGWPVGAPSGPVPLVMRITALRPLGRAMTRLPVGDRMARSMLARIGLRDALASGRFRQEGVDWFRAQLNHTDTMRNEIEVGPPVMDLRRGVRDTILLPDDVLGRVRVPTLLRWGTDDPFGGEAVAREFAARIPGASLELVRGGHAVWMDDADGAARSTRAFLTAGDA